MRVLCQDVKQLAALIRQLQGGRNEVWTYRDGRGWEERAKEDGKGCHHEKEASKSDGEVGCIQ